MNVATRVARSLPVDAAEALLGVVLETDASADLREYIDPAIRFLSDRERKLIEDRLSNSGPLFRTELLDALGDRIASDVVGDDQSELRKKIGDEGLLRSDLYRVEISPEIRARLSSRGIGFAHVVEALKAPTASQHFQSELNEPRPDDGSLSLYLREGLKSYRGVFAIVVVSFRKGTTQSVSDAFPLVADFVVDFRYTKPIDALIIALDHFGVPSRFAGSAEGSDFKRLHLLEQVLTTAPSPDVETEVPGQYRFHLHMAYPDGVWLPQPRGWASTQPVMVEVVLGYLVDETKLRRYLEQRSLVPRKRG